MHSRTPYQRWSYPFLLLATFSLSVSNASYAVVKYAAFVSSYNSVTHLQGQGMFTVCYVIVCTATTCNNKHSRSVVSVKLCRWRLLSWSICNSSETDVSEDVFSVGERFLRPKTTHHTLYHNVCTIILHVPATHQHCENVGQREGVCGVLVVSLSECMVMEHMAVCQVKYLCTSAWTKIFTYVHTYISLD